jgi:hypothetical protein
LSFEPQPAAASNNRAAAVLAHEIDVVFRERTGDFG